MSNNARVLIGSPIRQSPPVLDRFLQSLGALNKSNLKVDYYFVDDNDEIESKELLKNFSRSIGSSVLIEEANLDDVYVKNETTHFWDNNLIWKVAAFKNSIINYCKAEGYDYLLLIDSDLVLAPPTLEHLILADKQIISEIFWTKWQPNADIMPQVWLYDQYSFSDKNSYVDSALKYLGFAEKLRVPGIYKVGGLGACTLIGREALDKGVSFDQIYNISFWGEDRHFCIRAAALGIELFVDTSYPAFHIYRDEYLDKVEDYINTHKHLNTSPSSLLDIRSFTIEFLNQFYAYDCETKPYLSGISLLSEEQQRMINEKRSDIISCLSEYKAKCRVENCRIVKITEKGDAQEANAAFSFKTEKAGAAFEKEIYCDITLKKDYETIWKVYKIALKDKNGDSIAGFSAMELLME